MSIDEILGRGDERARDDSGYYKRIIGLCTKTANDVITGVIDVSLPGKFKSRAKMVKCVKCDLIDCLLRDNAKQQWPNKTTCPRCGGRQVRLCQ